MTPLKSLFDLWSKIAYTFPETSVRSIDRASRLLDHHQLNLLTQLLPMMGKWLDQCLACNRLLPLSGIKTTKKGYPVLLREYFELIFDEEGYVRNDSADTISKVRTLLYMFYKYEVPFTDNQLKVAKEKFESVDNSVKTEFTDEQIQAIRGTFNALLPPDPMDIKGTHSNGATADSIDNIKKRNYVRYIPSLMGVYGAQYFFNTIGHLKWYTNTCSVERCEPRSKVAFVPKDSRGPRTICMEPHERMFLQQGLMWSIYENVEKYSIGRGYVNFTNQEINRTLAYKASIDGSYATIDLKDASDLVSWSLISKLVTPEYLACLTALRTPEAQLPDGNVVRLKKFAPMGSALCFPIEAILFYSIARTITSDCYVYGDDIIVPTACANMVIALLEEYGLIVNREKSLLTGFFRESCGFDAFRGTEITPIRYRRDDLISVVAFANNMGVRFGSQVGEAVIRWYEYINQCIILRLSRSYEYPSAIAYRYSEFSNEILFRRRYNNDLQRYELRTLITTNITKRRAEDTYGMLFDYYTNTMSNIRPIDDIVHSPIRDNVLIDDEPKTRVCLVKTKVKYGWVPIW